MVLDAENMEINLDFTKRISTARKESVDVILSIQQNKYAPLSEDWLSYSWTFTEYACFDNSTLGDFRMDRGTTRILDLDPPSREPSCDYDMTYTVTLIEANSTRSVSFDESQEGTGLFASVSEK